MIQAHLALAIMVCALNAPGVLPEELQGLGEISDEKEFVTALRDFDRLQVELMDWDLVMARESGERGEKDLVEARKAQATQRLELVDAAYKEAVRRYPNNARVRNWYGEFRYDQAGDPTTALMSWKMATKLDPDLGAPFSNLGLHYCHTGDHTKCVGLVEQAVEKEPDNPDFLFNLTQLYFIHTARTAQAHGWKEKRVYTEAMKLSRRATELDPEDYDLLQDYAVNFFAAERFGITADWDKAAEAWQRAREKARNSDEKFYTWLNEGRVWSRKPDPVRAESCLRAALEIRPSSVAQKLLDQLVSGNEGREGESLGSSSK
jgi:tetratricopeptide (TPR) repeat protein